MSKQLKKQESIHLGFKMDFKHAVIVQESKRIRIVVPSVVFCNGQIDYAGNLELLPKRWTGDSFWLEYYVQGEYASENATCSGRSLNLMYRSIQAGVDIGDGWLPGDEGGCVELEFNPASKLDEDYNEVIQDYFSFFEDIQNDAREARAPFEFYTTITL